jgi:chorismate synthase
VPIVEAMTALVLCDHALRQRAIAVSAVSGVTIADRGAGIVKK